MAGMPKATKWTRLRSLSVWVLLILLIPFVIFFSGSAPGRLGGAAGKIFGRVIPRDTYDLQRTWLLMKLSGSTGQLPPEILYPLIEPQVWRNLLLIEEAKREHLRVSDQDLAAFIQQVPGFQEAGRFRRDYYQGYLRAKGMSPSLFEQLIRNDLIIDRLLDSVRATVSVTEREVRSAFREASERLSASVFLFEPSAYLDQAGASLTEEALRAFYDAHPQELRLPAQMTIEYVGASRRDLDEEHAARTLTALALDLQEDVAAKRSFDEIAASRALTVRVAGPFPTEGPFRLDGHDPALLEAAATLQEGQMTDVVETDAGVSLGRVTKQIAPRLPPFDEIRAAIRERLMQERSRSAAKASADALHARLKAQRAAGLRFEEAFLAAGAPPGRPATFTRTAPIEPLGSVPALNAAAFDTPLGALTEVIDTPAGWVLLRPEARIPADDGKFAGAEAGLREDTLKTKQHEHVQEWLSALEARAKIQRFLEAPPPASK